MPATTPPVPAQVRIPADQRARFEALCAARYAALPSAERAALSPRDHAIAVVQAALADGLDIAEDRARRVAAPSPESAPERLPMGITPEWQL